MVIIRMTELKKTVIIKNSEKHSFILLLHALSIVLIPVTSNLREIRRKAFAGILDEMRFFLYIFIILHNPIAFLKLIGKDRAMKPYI